jgi:phosphoserine phosphatase RsbU/P
MPHRCIALILNRFNPLALSFFHVVPSSNASNYSPPRLKPVPSTYAIHPITLPPTDRYHFIVAHPTPISPEAGAIPLPTFSARMKRPFSSVGLSIRRAILRSKEGWYRLTAGMEVHELWNQFKIEAGESSRLYRQDVSARSGPVVRSWTRPFRVFGYLFTSLLQKLSPARRVFFLLTIAVALMSILHVHFLIFTQGVEFAIAFGGLLILLALILGDHVSMQRDIEIAREIQRWLVPRRPPNVPGIDVAFSTRPAKTVGGDYYDAFLRPGEGPLLIAVADVSGKSVPAAMMMATFQASLRALANSTNSLSELVAGLNRQACAHSQNGRFTTAFLAELNPETGDLTYLCAGHNPPILRRADGAIERLKSENMPLGIELTEKYATGFTRIEPQDVLIIYTDGVTEARDEDSSAFGDKRLLSIAENTGNERAAMTLSNIMRILDDFVGAAPQHDDITCMVVRRT